MRNLMWPLIWGTTTLIGGATTLIGINYYRRNHIKLERITADEARILQASPEMDIIRQKLIKPDFILLNKAKLIFHK